VDILVMVPVSGLKQRLILKIGKDGTEGQQNERNTSTEKNNSNGFRIRS